MYIKTRGLVLRETNYKEADKILTVLTAEGGRRTVKARGCRRKGSKLAATTQLLAFSEMTLFEYRDYYTINEAESISQFWGMKSDVEKLALGAYFAEVTEAVAEEGRADEALFSLILNCLHALDKLDKPKAQVKAAFELRLACVAGYQPTLDACLGCGEDTLDGWLYLAEGVLRCRACAAVAQLVQSLPVPPGAMRAMRHIAWCDPKKILAFSLDDTGLAQLGVLTEAYLLTQLDRTFGTLEFYNGLRL